MAYAGRTSPTVYSDRGYGVRAPVVFYNRANEAAARLAPGDFDWAAIFRGGVRWFHSGGIFAALSATTPGLIVEAMEAAHAAGAVVSFDLNYRAKLWAPEVVLRAAQAVMSESSSTSTSSWATRRTCRRVLASPVPEVTAASSLDPSRFLAMMAEVVVRYPRVKVVATTLRQVISANRHSWSAVAWVNGESYIAPTMELDVYDRVGGGDGFAAGFVLWPADGPDARRSPAPGLGPRRVGHDLSRRHHLRDSRAGPRSSRGETARIQR